MSIFSAILIADSNLPRINSSMATMSEATQPKKDTSPRAAGPAGAQFEAKVAAHYALAVLAQTEAFGLPGAIVDRLEFQRSGLVARTG